jgi:dTDP-4-amino-4,6-dideoxygalactose transaminase
MRALGVEGGDEVITTPYTFVATVDAICLNNALPVFVDIDSETWQMDPSKIETAITPDTRVLLPVHILGGLCHMDKINALAAKYKLKVVEDACEAHLAEWKGKKAGALGNLGCFSLQNGKQLTCGEGGAITGDDEQVMDICHSFHDFGRVKGKYMPLNKGASPILGTKCRTTEFQASILMTQMDSLELETQIRSKNSEYLTSKLTEIPGIIPRKNYKEQNRDSYYYYGFRFKEEVFGFSRATFIKALRAEGLPADAGLGVIEGGLMHQEGVIESVVSSKTYRKLYSKERLDAYCNSLHFPEAERLVRETVGFKHHNLLGAKSDMDDIYRAILKIYENRDELKGKSF